MPEIRSGAGVAVLDRRVRTTIAIEPLVLGFVVATGFLVGASTI